MRWLRIFNPLYTLKLERQFLELCALSHRLADHSKRLALDANALVDKDAQALVEGAAAVSEIGDGLTAMRRTLISIAEDLSSGRPGKAHDRVKKLISALGKAA